ncbi:cysteine proteinase [Peniophora sp. CONT]|nr:cysteine proteinase [Peniophora sp. CONT]
MSRPSISAAEADALLTSAAKAELAHDYDSAFAQYIKAASAHLALSRVTAADGAERHKAAAARAVERAEKIKAAKGPAIVPVLRDPFAPEEQERVLRAGSVVNGLRLPPVTGTATESGANIDDRQPELSPEQLAAGVEWRQPVEPWVDATAVEGEDIAQRIADCSLHASVVAALGHSRRFVTETSIPSLCTRVGGYDLDVYFNGCRRRISIDPQLPYDRTGKLMCMASKRTTNLWPALLEKAYLKLYGGYDFPGSNSGVDLHTLLGWIPEHIRFKSTLCRPEQLWRRFANAFHDGHAVITLGTDKRASSWRGVKLIPTHSYAVIDISPVDDNERIMTLLDFAAEQEDLSSQMSGLSLGAELPSRYLRMPFEDIMHTFDSLFASYDPHRFTHRVTFHGTWRSRHLSEVDRDESCHQIFYLNVDALPEGSYDRVYVLLTRHISNTRLSSQYMSLKVEQEDVLPEPLISRRSEKSKVKGTYTDNPHVLHRYKHAPGSGALLSATASYDGQELDVGYTLEIFSMAPIRWDTMPRQLPFQTMVSGALTAKSAGGNHNLPTYMYNPQYKFTVSRPRSGGKARIAIVATSGRDLPINVVISWGKGERVVDLSKTTVLATSGAYSYSYARVSATLAPGTYTVIVSAFETTHLGAFALKVESDVHATLDPISPEGAGMFHKMIRGEWTSENHSPRYMLTLSEPMRVQIRLQMQDNSPSTSVRFALAGPQRFTFASELTDSPAGASMPRTLLREGRYLLAPSAQGLGDGRSFRLNVWSEGTGLELSIVDPPT